MGAFGTLLTLAVAGAIFRMLYRISGRFWAAWALSIPVYAAFLFNIAPPPLFFSVILFTITLSMLIDAQRSGPARKLYWLPPVFPLWAKIQIQFIDGLAILGVSRRRKSSPARTGGKILMGARRPGFARQAKCAYTWR